MLTISKAKPIVKEWPPLPYKGLSYYEPADAPLFAGRDNDVSECADLLARSETRILVLHGSTGCGKSSFLRAGLIPFLEQDELGFGFLKDGDDGKLKSIFVRSTGKPLVELAQKIWGLARADITLKKPQGEMYSVGLPEAVAEYGEEEFIKKSSNDPSVLIAVLGKMAARLPKTLVLIIDQGEEVITLKPDKGDDAPAQNFFRFVELFSQTKYDLKLVIALRTEFYGRFVAKMPQAQPGSRQVMHYLLDDLTKEQIVRAIERPTSEECIEGFGVPFKHYRFKYGKGLPEKIADDLLSKKLAGGILPVMQVVCDTLYQSTRTEAARQGAADDDREWEITEAAYRVLGSIEDQVEKSLNATLAQWCRDNSITSEVEIQKEIDRWKDVLAQLAGSQSDGTVTTDVVTADELKRMATDAGCRISFEKTMTHLVSPDVRILRSTEFVGSRSEMIVRYSLGHDAIGLVLYRWKVAKKEVADALGTIRSRLRALGFVVFSLCVVWILISWIGFKNYGFDYGSWFWTLVFYAVFFILLSYVSKLPAFDRMFYSVLMLYSSFFPKKSLQQLMKDRTFAEMLRRNPSLMERLQKSFEKS
ncbi:MAG TPA: ATP-binding protein [Chthoniobacterales bacterium]|nr:ATP-binding protein [Chthoniobacterales bacterium]